jgi:hypothetical protein
MCKKFISYLVIYSLLYSNALYAGNGGNGGMSDPNEPRTSLVIRQKPQPSPRTPLQRPTSRSLQDVNLVGDSFRVSINSPEPKTPAKSKRKRAKTPPPHQLSTSTHPKKSSAPTNSLLNASLLETLEFEKEKKETSRSPHSSESGETKSSLTKTSSSENLFPNPSSSPSKSPSNSQEPQDLDSSTSSAEPPPSREISLDLEEKTGLPGKTEPHDATRKTNLGKPLPTTVDQKGGILTETTTLLGQTNPSYTVKNSKLEGLSKREGGDLDDDESDSEGINFRQKTPEASLEPEASKDQGEVGGSTPSLHDGAHPQDGLQEVSQEGTPPQTPEIKQPIDKNSTVIEINLLSQPLTKKKHPLQSPGPLIPDFLKKKFLLKNQKTEFPDSSIVTLEDEGALLPKISFFDDFPPEDKAMLIRIAQQDLEGKLTPAQKKVIALAFFLSAGFSVAMWPLFNGGLIYIRDVYKWPAVTYITLQLAGLLGIYIIPSTFFDAFPRNLTALKKAATYLEEEKINKWRVGLTAVASVFPSLQKVGCLILFELYLMNRTHTHGWNNQFVGAMLGLGPFLFTDSAIANYKTLWELGDDMEGWVATSSSLPARWLYPYVIDPPLLSEKDILKGFHLNRLASFRHTLSQRSPEDINEIYASILNARNHTQRDLPELDGDTLDAAQAFFLLRYLLVSGDEKGMERPKTIVSSKEDKTIGLILTTGTPFRLLASQLLWETAFSLVFSPPVAKGLGWFFGTLAAFIQTGLEYKGMKNYSHNYIGDEDEDTQCYLGLRATLKAVCSFQGFMFTTILAALCVQVCDRWFPNLWYLIGAIPYVLAEYAILTNSYNNTYNKQGGTVAIDIHNQWTKKKLRKEPSVDYKCEYILRMSKKAEVWLKKLPHFAHEKLQETLILRKEGEEGAFINTN